jgi:ribosomal protein L14E/L6E/L27E
MEGIALGQIVHSKAGRDKDRYFIVVGIIDNDYVLVADGQLRKINSPKKKKIKHLRKLNYVAQAIKDKVESCEKLSNSEIRKLLKSID